MKKNKRNNETVKKPAKAADETTTIEKTNTTDPLDDENQGFGGWLRSEDGLETMKLFVIANSIVMLTTIVYPHLQTAIEILGEMFYGVEETF